MKKATTATFLIISTLTFGLGAFLVTEKTSAEEVSCISLNNNLRIGSIDAGSNMEVSKLQNFLQSKGYMTIPATGYFGNITSKAVKDFQTKENISAIGIVGPLTRSRINLITCIPALPVSPAPTPDVSIPTPVDKPVELTLRKLPYASTNFIDWKNVWGNVSTTSSHTLLINASVDTTGAQALLSNSSEWTNYKINANVFVKQATVTLMSRYVDENNFLACTFSGRYVEIIQKVNGISTVVTSTTVAEAPYTRYFYNDLNFSMTVNKNTVSCSLVGEDNLVFDKVDEKLMKGGVGIQAWSNTNGIANIELKNITIVSI